jgi:hypothetical protein
MKSFMAQRKRQRLITKLILEHLRSERKKKLKRLRRAKKIRNWRTSTWWEMLQEEDVKDPLSRAGKTFRNRFRVPYPVFEQLLEMANEIAEEQYQYHLFLIVLLSS